MVQRYLARARAAALLPALLAALALALGACGGETATHEFAGAELMAEEPLPDFSLTAAGDAPVSLSDFRGQYVYLYFGYTFCPDFCPTTLAKLANVQDRMGDDAGRVQVMMITVDPERDTPEVLARYVQTFDPSFIGLTGTTTEIDDAAQSLGVFFQRNEGSAASGYLVDHSTRTYLIGPDGRALVAYPHDAEAGAMAADLRWLIDQES